MNDSLGALWTGGTSSAHLGECGISEGHADVLRLAAMQPHAPLLWQLELVLLNPPEQPCFTMAAPEERRGGRPGSARIGTCRT